MKIWQKEYGSTTVLTIVNKCLFLVLISHNEEEGSTEVVLIDIADVEEVLAIGLGAIALNIAPPDEVRDAIADCLEVSKGFEKVPKKLIKELGLEYDDFHHGYVGTFYEPRKRVMETVIQKIRKHLSGKSRNVRKTTEL